MIYQRPATPLSWYACKQWHFDTWSCLELRFWNPLCNGLGRDQTGVRNKLNLDRVDVCPETKVALVFFSRGLHTRAQDDGPFIVSFSSCKHQQIRRTKAPAFRCPPPTPTTMTDLTVLISPTPLYAPMMRARPFSFRRSTPNLITPTMVTLETERESEDSESPEAAAAVADTQSDSEPTQDLDQDAERPQPRRRGRALSRIVDPNFLSPPINTFKSSGHPIPPLVK